MSWLYIDTHESGVLRFALLKKGGKPKLRVILGRGQKLLPKISSYLAELEGVFCVSGPGSFSAIRIGVLDANLIARLKSIPLVGLEYHGETETLAKAQQKLDDGGFVATEYLAPIYDAEPNITLPKA
ncbi:MAG: hypothetical protein U0487_01065 [Patescibacteria group bacterium]